MQHRRAAEEPPDRGARPGPAAAQQVDFARIVREHEQRVRRVLRRRGVAERDVADAQQEVFLVVHRKLAEFEQRSSLGTWLHRIALNVASEHHRRARNRYERLCDATRQEVSAENPQAAIEARDALARVNAALEALSDAQRDAFLLHDVAGLSMHEVAEQLGIPFKTAFSRLYAARRALAAALGRRGIAPLTLLAWLASAWLPSRLRSRARALECSSLSAPAAPLQLAVLALAVGALPALVAVPAAPAVLADGSLVSQPVQRWVRSGTAVPARHASQVQPVLLEAAAALATTHAPPPRELRSTHEAVQRSPARSAADGAAATVMSTAERDGVLIAGSAGREPSAYDFTVTRSGEHDLKPRLAHPLSERIAPPRAPPRIRVNGPHGASGVLD